MLRLRSLRAGLVLALSPFLAACGGGPRIGADTSYDAERLVIRDFIGTLTIQTADVGEITVHVEATREQLDILPMTLSGGTLTIEWDGEPDRPRRWYEFWRGRWMADLNDLGRYPNLVVTVPADVEIEITELIGRWTIGDREGAIAFGATHGSGTIGATRNAAISISGDADVDIGPVAERLAVSVVGSGSLTGTTAASAELSVAGSGDARIGDVAGAVSISVAGSGHAAIGNAGDVEASVSGSGTVAVGAIGAFRAVVQGSGDIDAVSVEGMFAATVSGSGGITVETGRGSPFEVTIAGSGDIRFGGTAIDPKATISGSGSLVIGVVEGQLDAVTTGTGDVQVLRDE